MYTADIILVPVDFSDTAAAAISVALQMADKGGSRLIFLHVDPTVAKEMGDLLDPGLDSSINDEITGREAGIRESVAKELARAAEAGHELVTGDIDVRISSGDWVEVALSIIEEEKVNLVVAATHGGDKSGLFSIFQGSSAEKLVRRAPCSVFVVKPEGFPYLTD